MKKFLFLSFSILALLVFSLTAYCQIDTVNIGTSGNYSGRQGFNNTVHGDQLGVAMKILNSNDQYLQRQLDSAYSAGLTYIGADSVIVGKAMIVTYNTSNVADSVVIKNSVSHARLFRIYPPVE